MPQQRVPERAQLLQRHAQLNRTAQSLLPGVFLQLQPVAPRLGAEERGGQLVGHNEARIYPGFYGSLPQEVRCKSMDSRYRRDLQVFEGCLEPEIAPVS